MKVGPLQKKQNELFEIAESQQGYFTAKQAESVGFLPTNFQYHVKTGAWVREERGIYRLKNFPHAQVEAQYVHYALWSRDRGDQIQGVYSHETALSIYELSDVMPNKLHMSVPENFRKSAKTPKSLKLHYSDVPKEDREGRIGYFVTRPLRTLVDLMQTQETSEEHIEQALIQALDRGLILMREINSPRVPAEIQTKFNEWITHHRSKMKKAVGA
ncbi:MAG: type IV toxin-antitoxin system AbiEi family antitoxin domain-containing protein [Bdellovibrionales bacterium]|nr:type IV toxin-antitoxin system AbiEi family antitoxin domain-containing protein [Bdellovibrionales bacterium]